MWGDEKNVHFVIILLGLPSPIKETSRKFIFFAICKRYYFFIIIFMGILFAPSLNKVQWQRFQNKK